MQHSQPVVHKAATSIFHSRNDPSQERNALAAMLASERYQVRETIQGLSRSLQRRHMQMIALGGVIGAGLFVGSGVVVQATGPAAVISFALTGTLVVLVMRMLGEMASAYPAVGGFYLKYRGRICTRSRRCASVAAIGWGWRTP